MTYKKRNAIIAAIVIYLFLAACEPAVRGHEPAPTPPVLKDVYATTQTRINEMQTEVSK